MRTALLSAMLFLAAFCRARPAPLQAEKKTVLPVKRYSLEAGLIQSMPHFARTDENGLLWVGTAGGLHWFDGQKFHPIRHRAGDSSSLPDNEVRNIFFGADGRCYVSSVYSISLFDRHSGTFKVLLRSPAGRQVAGLGPDHTPLSLYTVLGTDIYSIYKARKYPLKLWWKNNCVPPVNAYPKKAVLWGDKLLLACFGGLVEIELSGIKNGYPALWIPLAGNRYSSIAQDPHTQQVYLAWNGRTYRYDGNAVLTPLYDNGLKSPQPGGFLIDSRGNHWIADAHTHELCLFRNGQKQILALVRREDRSGDTLHTAISFLDEDRNGNIWMGTDGQGLLQYNPNTFSFDRAQVGFIRGIAEMNGYIWAGTYGNGLWKLTKDLGLKYRIHNTDIGPAANIAALLVDTRERLWVLSDKGIAVLDRNDRTIFRFRQDLVQGTLFMTAEDSVVLSLPGRMEVFYAGAHIIHRRRHQGMPLIKGVVMDGQNRLWARGTDTLFRLPAHIPLTGLDRQRDALERLKTGGMVSVRNKIFIGAEGAIRAWDENGRFFGQLSLPGEIVADSPYGLLPDKTGRLWISSDRGLACLDPVSGKWYVFGTDDNLQSLEFSRSAFLQTNDGRIYYGGIEGINGFRPDQFRPLRQVPAPFLTTLRCYDTAYCRGIPPRTIQLSMQSKNSGISGSVASGDYTLPGTRYSFRLEGYENTWSVPAEQHGFRYEKLPPGGYTLLCRATDRYGNESAVTALLQLHIRPPFWQNGWFRALTVLSLAAAIAYLLRLYQQQRYRRIIRRWQEKDAVNRERLRIARDLHDDIGAELSLIAILARGKQAADNGNLEKISEKTSTLIENLRHIYNR